MTDRGASIHGDLKYSSDIYDRDTIQAVLHRFIVLLESAVLDPGTPIEALEILPPAERTLLLTEWNRTDAPYPSDTVFVRLFEQQVQRTPQAIAVSSGNARLTYRDLDIGANRLAHRLRELGVVSRSMVGVCLERTPDLLVALLAVQKAGGAYVPLDPSFPVERLRRMVSDSGAHLVVTTASAPGELTDGLLRLDLDAERDRRDRFDGLQAPSVDPGPDDPAYVIYTSGSTGEPNGVAVSHGALVNFLWASRLAPGMSSSDVLGAVASMSFDISGFDFYLPLLVGARIALVDRTTAMDGAALAACFAREGVTTMVSTPSTWRLLLDAGWSGHAQFRALVGGERWSRDLADPLLDRVGELWNLYGPTETTIWSTAERIVKGDGPITIGRPIANTQMYVVDGRGEPVPAGVLGEICVGGAGVAIGYHRREALTAERFVADPFRGQGRLYRTGDLGRWRSDGRLECVGRRDHQVKVRGHRIELGEIDAVLCRHDAVADAVVDAREAPNGDRSLVAYVVLRPGATLTCAHMAAHLRRSLPDYMVPGPLAILDALPLSPTGKVDRKALPDPATAQADRPYEPPATATERLLSAVWADVLDLRRVGRSDQFFELGGHSILVVSMLQRLGRVGVRVDVRTVFAHPVLADLASAIDMAPAAAATVAGATSPTCISGPPPALSPDDRARIASALPGGEASIEAICPLLPTQHGLLAEHLLDDEGARASYVARATLAFDTRAGLDGFLDAVRTVIARHEALRASLVWEGIAQPVQVIHRAPPLPVLEVESTEVTADAAAVRFLRIDPSRAPLIRAVVHPGIAPGDWRLTLAIHHLITDQTSTMVVMDEVRTILAGGAATLAPAPSYRAQVLSADQSTPLEHETYFRELLGDVDEPTHVFGVADMRGAGRPLGEARICLEADVTSALREAARRHGVTPAVICHVAAAIVVGACSGRDDVVFGTVLLGRSGQAAGADRTVGMFVNALPVRIALADVDLAVAVRNANAQLSA
ncbi:MAG TPA: amino acid adenylation domain-containing protein, partial [Ilumatobacteraceae bacterium]|nr:amino acid adenylation domain-containing protein [Ilumatobacteraceae bacterium]